MIHNSRATKWAANHLFPKADRLAFTEPDVASGAGAKWFLCYGKFLKISIELGEPIARNTLAPLEPSRCNETRLVLSGAALLFLQSGSGEEFARVCGRGDLIRLRKGEPRLFLPVYAACMSLVIATGFDR